MIEAAFGALWGLIGIVAHCLSLLATWIAVCLIGLILGAIALYVAAAWVRRAATRGRAPAKTSTSAAGGR